MSSYAPVFISVGPSVYQADTYKLYKQKYAIEVSGKQAYNWHRMQCTSTCCDIDGKVYPVIKW